MIFTIDISFNRVSIGIVVLNELMLYSFCFVVNNLCSDNYTEIPIFVIHNNMILITLRLINPKISNNYEVLGYEFPDFKGG